MALLLLQTKLLAQKKVYSLRKVLQKTVEQYPSLSSKKYEIERQQLRKDLVKKEQLPDVNFQAQQSYGSYQGVSGAFFPLAGIYNTSGNNKGLNGQSSSVSNAYTSAVLQWDFLQFGRIKSKLQVADAAIQISTTALSQEELRLQSIAAEQYFNVLQSSAFLSTAQADVQRCFGCNVTFGYRRIRYRKRGNRIKSRAICQSKYSTNAVAAYFMGAHNKYCAGAIRGVCY